MRFTSIVIMDTLPFTQVEKKLVAKLWENLVPVEKLWKNLQQWELQLHLLSGRKKLLGKRCHSFPTHRLISATPENYSV